MRWEFNMRLLHHTHLYIMFDKEEEKTIMNMERCMLKEKKLPHNFWSEAMYETCYALNRSAKKSLESVPKAIWLNKTPFIKNFKIFGSLCSRRVPDHKRKKLDDKNEPMILVGYHFTGSYMLYSPLTKKITTSRYVTINEMDCWNRQE